MQWCERAFGGIVHVGFERLDVLVPRQAIAEGGWSRESSMCHAHRQALSETDEELGERWTLAGPLIGTHGFCTSVDDDCAYHAVPPVVLIGMLGYVMRLANESNVAVSLACQWQDFMSANERKRASMTISPSFVVLATDARTIDRFSQVIAASVKYGSTYLLEKLQTGSDVQLSLRFSRFSQIQIRVIALNSMSWSITWRAVPFGHIETPLLPVSQSRFSLRCPSGPTVPPSKRVYFYSSGKRAILYVRRKRAAYFLV
jgi:hypothetical protein